MASFIDGVKTQHSVASLSSAMHQDTIIVGIIADADDLTIATGLLAGARAPQRRTSFSGTSLGQQSLKLQDAPHEVNGAGTSRRVIQSSNAWTTSSGEILSDHDEVDDRRWYIDEYNDLTKKHGIRLMVIEDYDENDNSANLFNKPASWFSRNILRRASSTVTIRQVGFIKHRRSISDLSLRRKGKSEWTKHKDLQDLVRLCGACLLYLPSEYAYRKLALPTCFRATAHYLVQNGPNTKGIFRVNGATSVVEALYNHFCTVGHDGEVVAETVRIPILPDHIRCDVNDVASTFKRFLKYLPGGILGSLPLFDALVAIEGQLQGDPEFAKIKETKVRARLIALAIFTVRSQYRRDLISAVFGLLSFIGRATEVEPSEDERGRPLPTSDLMGYTQLGIVFGPLLVGELLDKYSMRLADPTGGLVLLPVTPPKSRKERKRKKPTTEDFSTLNLQVDKYKVVNTITEMLITNWREVVRHMRSLSALKAEDSKSMEQQGESQPPFLRTSISETFALRKPPDWEANRELARRNQRAESPTPIRHTAYRSEIPTKVGTLDNNAIFIQKQRARQRPKSCQMLSRAPSFKLLSPTKENPSEEFTSFLASTCSSINFSGTYNDTTNIVVGDHPSSRKIRDRPGTPSAKFKFPKYSKLSEDSGTARQKSPSTPSKAHLHHHSTRNPLSLRGKHSFSLFNAPNGKDNTSLKHLHALDIEPTSFLSQKLQMSAPSSSRRKVSSEPSSNQMNSRAAKTTVFEPRPRSAYTARFLNRDPLSRISHEEDIASLVEIGRVLKETAEAQEIEARNSDECKFEDALTHVSHEEDIASVTVSADALGYMEAPAEPSTPITSDPVSSKATSNDVSCHVSDEGLARSLAIAGDIMDCRDSTSGVEFQRASLSGNAVDYEKNRIDQDSGKNKQKSTSSDIPTPSKKSGKSFIPLISSFIRGHEKTSSVSSIPKNIHRACFDVNGKDIPKPSSIDSQNNSKDTFGARLSPVKAQEDRQHARNTLKEPMMTSSGSVKALAEKFNNQSPSKDREPSSSLEKLNRKSISNDTWPSANTPKRESLVSPYTMNSSPSKSQKSVTSERTPKSTRTPAFLIKDRTPLKDTGTNPIRSSSPRLTMSSSVEDKKSLRSMQKSFDAGDDKPASFTVNSFKSSSVSLSAVESSPVGAKSFDSHANILVNAGVPNFGTILPAPEEPPVAHHIRFSRPSSILGEELTQFSHAESRSRDIHKGSPPQKTTPSYGPGTSSVPRSNSVLHSQVRALQNNLDAKDREIRTLRQHKASVGSMEYGTLSEQLREKTREAEMWKKRAEAAEKKLEIFTKIQQRRTASNRLSNAIANVYQSAPEFIEKSMVNKKQSTGRDMDGAQRSLGSDQSNDTIVREDSDVFPTENEDEAQRRVFHLWMAQTEESLKAAPYIIGTGKAVETPGSMKRYIG